MAVHRGAPRQAAPRRKTQWEEGPHGDNVAISSTTSSLGTSVVSVVSIGVTVVRIRGYFNGILTLATAVGDGFRGAFGIGIASTAAIAVGSTAVPTPLTELGSDIWMYHRFFNTHGITATIADGVNAVAARIDFELDTKAMRKLDDPSFTLYSCLEVIEDGIATANFHWNTRMLVKPF